MSTIDKIPNIPEKLYSARNSNKNRQKKYLCSETSFLASCRSFWKTIGTAIIQNMKVSTSKESYRQITTYSSNFFLKYLMYIANVNIIINLKMFFDTKAD